MIFLAVEQKPTADMITKGFEANNQGAGMAWREKKPDSDEVLVHWEKGLELDRLIKLAEEKPLPYVIHCRISSCGDGGKPELTHPFPVEANVPLWLKGTTGGFVLFHNGHWTDWRKWTLEMAVRANRKAKLQNGKWSDSRAMAYCASQAGLGVLEMIDEKVVAFGPTECHLYHNVGWTKKDGVWCSNMGWEHRHTFTEAGANFRGSSASLCLEPKCNYVRMAGHTKQYCFHHQHLERNANPAKCVVVNCKNMRFPAGDNTMYCEDHASSYGYGEVVRAQKLLNAQKELDDEAEAAAKAGDKGGSSTPLNFRNGDADAGQTPDNSGGVQAGKGGTRSVSVIPEAQGATTGNGPLIRLASREQMEEFVWAATINENRYKRRNMTQVTPFPSTRPVAADTDAAADGHRNLRLADAREGIVHIGPM